MTHHHHSFFRFLVIFAAVASESLLWPGATLAAAPCADVNDQVVNVRNFRAQGDGATDDTSAIQAAADCAIDRYQHNQYGDGRTGASLYFPAGTYVISKHIVLEATQAPKYAGGLVVSGDGASSSKIVNKGTSGIFSVIMAGLMLRRGAVGLEMHDLGMVAAAPGAGDALDIRTPEAVSAQPDPFPLLSLRVRNVTVGAARPTKDYFDYGINAVGLFVPYITKVQMSGVDSTCFLLDVTYAPMIEHSSCAGAKVGVDVPHAAEGEFVTDSQITNVQTGIRITVVPHHIRGPSNSRGGITGNTITAQSRGVDITWKMYMFIDHNVISQVGKNAAYSGIVLNKVGQARITHNTFSGAGAGSTAVLLMSDLSTPGAPTHETLVADNVFNSLTTYVYIGRKVYNTLLRDTVLSTTNKFVVDLGVGTQILPQ